MSFVLSDPWEAISDAVYIQLWQHMIVNFVGTMNKMIRIALTVGLMD
jgi:hypothetical protein